jgi:hypothetical protein
MQNPTVMEIIMMKLGQFINTILQVLLPIWHILQQKERKYNFHLIFKMLHNFHVNLLHVS